MKLLSLDFDGCTHKASDLVLLNFREGAPAWEIEIALKAQKRFVWAPLLNDIVQDTDVSIIIHSTWRKRFDDATLKHFLPPEVASRVISLDGQIEGRETLSSDDYLNLALELIAPASVCVIDDRPEFFFGGKTKDWVHHNHGDFIWCHPEIGLQDRYVREQLSTWCQLDVSRDQPPVPTL